MGQPNDLVIVGGGPAGLSAAIYAGRSRLTTTLIEGAFLGGQLTTATEIWNLPGFPDGIGGEECIARLEKQARMYGAEIANGEATSVSREGDLFTVKMGEGDVKARSAIIATGASVKKLGVKGEEELAGRGVSYCATCDGALFSGKDVVMMGGGDTAIDEALFLARFAKSVTVVHRRDRLRATEFLQEKAFSDDRIAFAWNSVIDEIVGTDAVEGVVLKDARTGARRSVAAEGVFIAVGRVPSSSLVRGLLDLDESGYIVTNARMEASVPGAYAAGDVRSGSWKQVATAIGEGVAAALCAREYLESLT